MTVLLSLPNGYVFEVEDVVRWKVNGNHLRLYFKAGNSERCIQTNLPYFFVLPADDEAEPDWTDALKKEVNW